MSNLLQVLRFQPKALQQKGSVPLMVDIPVSPDTAPYLVSSSTSFVWIEEPHPGDQVKAAVRTIKSPGDVFTKTILEVERRGRADEWGNVHPFTEDGVHEAIRHLEYYGIDDFELLVPRERPATAATRKTKKHPATKRDPGYKRPLWLVPDNFGRPMRPSSWLPDGMVVVLPVDRNFVGTMGHLTSTKVIVIIHNASRGIGIARDAVAAE